MLEPVLAWVQELMRVARQVYGVDPVIFLGLYLGCAPVWYFSLFRTLRALAARRVQQVMIWSSVFMLATVLPFLYVLLFGHNIPWWVYVLILLLVVQGLYGLVRKVRSGRRTAVP